MVHMSHAYLTEKQMTRWFWFHSTRHSAQMTNHIPAKYKDTLASLFMLVHGTQADCHSWILLFSICYCCFRHDPDGSTKRPKN